MFTLDYADFIINMDESELSKEIEYFISEFHPPAGNPVAAIPEKIENALFLMEANTNFQKTGSSLEPVLQRQALQLMEIITMLETKR